MRIRQFATEDFDAALSVIVAAFQNGSLYKFVAPDASARAEFLEAMFRLRMKFCLKKAEVYVAVAEKIVGVAVWIPPYVAMMQEDMAESGGAEVFDKMTPDVRKRWTDFAAELSRLMKKYIQQPFWSLAPIVVLPERQGEGIASLLIRKQLEKIDAQKLPCVLATQDEKNVVIYQRYGFKVVGEDKIPASSVINYAMVRPAGRD